MPVWTIIAATDQLEFAFDGRSINELRVARDLAVEGPEFALAAGMTALRGIANGWGYDITGIDVLDAYAVVMAAAGAAGVDETVVKADVRVIIAASRGGGEFVGRVLGRQLVDPNSPTTVNVVDRLG